MFPVIMTLKCNFDSLFVFLDGWMEGVPKSVATSQISSSQARGAKLTVIDLRGRAATVVYPQSLGRQSPSGAGASPTTGGAEDPDVSIHPTR